MAEIRPSESVVHAVKSTEVLSRYTGSIGCIIIIVWCIKLFLHECSIIKFKSLYYIRGGISPYSFRTLQSKLLLLFTCLVHILDICVGFCCMHYYWDKKKCVEFMLHALLQCMKCWCSMFKASSISLCVQFFPRSEPTTVLTCHPQ